MMEAAYRCYWCEWKWPLHPDFEVCPCCREACYTAQVVSDTVLDEDEAHRWRKEFAFGWWLWDTGKILTDPPPEPYYA